MPKLSYCFGAFFFFSKHRLINPFFSDIPSSTKCPSSTGCANSKFFHEDFHEDFHGQPPWQIPWGIYEIPRDISFLIEIHPSHESDQDELRQNNVRCWVKEANALVTGSEKGTNFFHEASWNSQSWTSASSTKWALNRPIDFSQTHVWETVR